MNTKRLKLAHVLIQNFSQNVSYFDICHVLYHFEQTSLPQLIQDYISLNKHSPQADTYSQKIKFFLSQINQDMIEEFFPEDNYETHLLNRNIVKHYLGYIASQLMSAVESQAKKYTLGSIIPSTQVDSCASIPKKFLTGARIKGGIYAPSHFFNRYYERMGKALEYDELFSLSPIVLKKTGDVLRAHSLLLGTYECLTSSDINWDKTHTFLEDVLLSLQNRDQNTQIQTLDRMNQRLTTTLSLIWQSPTYKIISSQKSLFFIMQHVHLICDLEPSLYLKNYRGFGNPWEVIQDLFKALLKDLCLKNPPPHSHIQREVDHVFKNLDLLLMQTQIAILKEKIKFFNETRKRLKTKKNLTSYEQTTLTWIDKHLNGYKASGWNILAYNVTKIDDIIENLEKKLSENASHITPSFILDGLLPFNESNFVQAVVSGDSSWFKQNSEEIIFHQNLVQKLEKLQREETSASSDNPSPSNSNFTTAHPSPYSLSPEISPFYTPAETPPHRMPLSASESHFHTPGEETPVNSSSSLLGSPFRDSLEPFLFESHDISTTSPRSPTSLTTFSSSSTPEADSTFSTLTTGVHHDRLSKRKKIRFLYQREKINFNKFKKIIKRLRIKPLQQHHIQKSS